MAKSIFNSVKLNALCTKMQNTTTTTTTNNNNNNNNDNIS